MSKISEADKKAMYELAEEIIECKRENDHREAIGIGSDSEKICRLYDLSDSLFCAERVKSLLDELSNVTEMAREWKGLLFKGRVSSRLAVGDRVFKHTENAEALKYAEENGLTITPIWDEDEQSFADYMEHWHGKTT